MKATAQSSAQAYAGAGPVSSVPGARRRGRARYYQLLNRDEFPEIGTLAVEIVDRELDHGAPERLHARSGAPSAIGDEAVAGAVADASRWRDEVAAATAQRSHDLSPALAVELVLQHAPAALVHGCWLENVSGPATSHTEVAAQLLKIHAEHVGAGNPAAHWGNRYARLLRGCGVSVPDACAWGFAQHEALFDFAFDLPVFELAIARSSRARLPELLGVHLFAALYGTPPVITEAVARSAEPASGAFLIDAASPNTRAVAIRDAMAAIDAYLARPEPEVQPIDRPPVDARARILAGFAAMRRLHERWHRAACALIEHAGSRAHARMVALVARKARYACGYHARTALHGRSLDEWFGAERVDAESFVRALGRSRLVKPGNAKRSALLIKSLTFGSPMFRVFSEDELATIAAWIDSLPARDSAVLSEPAPLAAPAYATDVAPGELHGEIAIRRGPFAGSRRWLTELGRGALATLPSRAEPPLRELYFRLLDIERYPGVLPAARRFADLWLAGASIGLRRGPRALPFDEYSHQALSDWLDVQHRRQVESYVPLTGEPPLTREQVVDSAVQLCPMVFIDGAWVQAFTSTQLAGTEIGALLFHIYYDEAGNGDPEINHPNVYRRLMIEMGVEIPPFGSREFAWWPRFQDASFEVPTFWLAISQFPRSLLPEILGINLAMELSGVGGSYRQGRDLLRHYGYDTTFIELHNTIDNVSTGHTALARRAIQLHMDEMLARGGKPEVHRHWLRVWTGYRALIPPGGRLNPILRRLKFALASAMSRAA